MLLEVNDRNKEEQAFVFQDMECHEPESGFEGEMLGKGQITVLRFVRKDDNRKQLNFFVVNWTHITEKAKQQLRDFDNQYYREEAEDCIK